MKNPVFFVFSLTFLLQRKLMKNAREWKRKGLNIQVRVRLAQNGWFQSQISSMNVFRSVPTSIPLRMTLKRMWVRIFFIFEQDFLLEV